MSKRSILSLDGIWELYHTDPGRGEEIGLHLEREPAVGSIPARVPGEVHLDLKQAGIIPDPYYGQNAKLCYWIHSRDWWYRRRFRVDRPARRILLEFKGLDTFATIYLNGERVGEHEDMHFPAVLDVTDRVRIGGENVLAVKLGSPEFESKKRAGEPVPVWNGTYERVYTRKAEMGYGWDWAMPIMPVGIYRSVLLHLIDSAIIEDVFVKPRVLGEDEAEVDLEVTLRSYLEEPREALFRFEAECGESVISGEKALRIEPGENRFELSCRVENPKLWFPWTVGEPHLYRMRSELLMEGEIVDEHRTSFGIREVELVRYSRESPNGKVFYFAINGVRVWAKGANWVVPDLLYPAVEKQRYRRLIEMAKEANMNMLRVWGGGIVESEEFYRLCDEMGIMVWQDFPFACGIYPEDEGYLELVRREAEHIVKRLRNHPCIVLWCGNNENETLAHSVGMEYRDHKIFYRVLPEVCSWLDPTRPYHPGSPSGGEEPNSPEEGDRHSWEVWFGLRDYRRIDDMARFASEFGCQAPPCVESLEKFIPPDKLWPISEDWLYHMMQAERMIYWSSEFGAPSSLEEFVRSAQLAQATILKHYIEHYRRLKFVNGGALIWDLVAPCPNISWSLIDYYLRPKMAYYEVKRAFSEVIVSIKPETEEWFSLWISNDGLRPIRGELLVQLRDFRGRVKLEERLEIEVPENRSMKVGEVNANPEDPTTDFLYVRLIRDGKAISENRHFFVMVKYLNIPPTKLSVRLLSCSREGADVEISSDGYARLVQLKAVGVEASFSDNFFDIINGDGRTVRARFEGGERPAELIVSAQNAEPVRIKLSR